jgi:PAS domain S-box-containing protein
MCDAVKTRAQLIEELAILRRRTAELEAAEARRGHEEEEWKRRLTRLTTLVDMTWRITQGLDLPSVLYDISEAVAQVFDGEACFRLLEGEFLVRVGETLGTCHAMIREHLRLGESIAGRVAASGQPMITADIAADPRVIPEHRVGAQAIRARALLCLPVRVGDRTLGTLHISKDRGYRFNREDLDLGIRLANQAAIAITNARLYTQLKETEVELRDSEGRHRALVEQSLVGIYIIQDERLCYVNPKFAEIFGYTPEEITETLRSGKQLVSEKDRARVRAKIQRRLRGKAKTLHYTFQGRRKDGALIDVEVYGSVMALNDKPAVIGTLLDITDRKRAERAVQNSEERYRALVEGSIQGISISRNAIHLFANRALATMLGYQDPVELLGKSTWRHVASHDVERLRSYFEARLRGEPAPARYEYQAHKTDGTPLWIERQVSPIMWVDELAYLGTYFDITERKQAEQALQSSRVQLRALASRRLAAQEEERRRIAREFHDVVGQNLTALKLDLLWIDRRLTADQSAVHQKIAQMAELSEHMVDTVGEIMTALRPAILDDLGLAAAIEWQVDVFQERTGIAVRVACNEDATRGLGSEQSLALFRILQETLTNVARHAAATMVTVRLSAVAGVLHLEVRDNGCGIPDDAIDNPRSLGLLGMRERVLPWDGEVHIQGYPGQGSVVNIRLPLANESPQKKGVHL